MTEYYSIAKDLYSFLEKLADDYKEAIPEAEALYGECEIFREIISGIEIKEKRKSKAIEKIKKDIEEANKKAKELIDNAGNERNLLGKTAFNIKLLAKAKGYRALFDKKREEIRENLKILSQTQHILRPEPPSRLPVLAKLFWTSSFGENTMSVGWFDFTTKYSLELIVNVEELERIKPYLCVNEHVTTYSFYAACTQFGYPILCPTQPVIDTMALANSIIDLTKEFYLPTFGTRWYMLRDLRKKDQDRDQFCQALKDIFYQDKDRWESINKARGIVSSLFQRYMMIWRIGKASQEMFDNVDFPGKSRIKTFIRICEPIDEINYKFNLNLENSIDKKPWAKGKPQVYDFLRTLIDFHDE
ncbi:hypothetical protein DL89DRAFT_261384 [Linderina pennispora]|uniref:Uncharacterized protein n=1 Tax=Linderina pennispora TaxID=61395 RepID=A0A1Y1VWR5_9FUNG|nr:uncharacterized protein DL89DRAFT_261384 [Linderina pennispora]ORX65184.1 hypothetical protein DL89DRAFT_261384 [Linderina pennispora]